jgi:hypothetical protein
MKPNADDHQSTALLSIYSMLQQLDAVLCGIARRTPPCVVVSESMSFLQNMCGIRVNHFKAWTSSPSPLQDSPFSPSHIRLFASCNHRHSANPWSFNAHLTIHDTSPPLIQISKVVPHYRQEARLRVHLARREVLLQSIFDSLVSLPTTKYYTNYTNNYEGHKQTQLCQILGTYK